MKIFLKNPEMTDISQDTDFTLLEETLEGDIYSDIVSRLIYATDASSYRELPVAVCCPAGEDDIRKIVRFASGNGISVIPRAAGTSLAGQVVGSGIIVDVSRYMNSIIELNPEEKWVRVQPGVILDELNQYLLPHGLFFGPETSTSSRCMMGGMVGNNSCGARSLIYGSTREHTLEVKAVLSDGSSVLFRDVSDDEFMEKCKGNTLEGKLYRSLFETLSKPEVRKEIIDGFPDPEVTRRNTGYALDLLLNSEPFTKGGKKFNFCRLIAGSEGTLAMITEIKLNLVPLPPAEKAVACIHFRTKKEALSATLVALEFNPGAVEMMDHIILELTKANIEQRKNRLFIEGDPAAILIVEFARDTREEIVELAAKMEARMRAKGYGYHYPVLTGDDIAKVWNLRKAGLGVLAGMKGDAKSVTLIEDTSVAVRVLPEYIGEVQALLDSYGKEVVYHAHVGSGELHMRPVLNLKDPADVELYYTIGKEVAHIVKKYRGSLSGEHGDGRLRGEFIPIVLGEKNYQLLREVKKVWDPQNVFNPGKITDTPAMNTSLRYVPGRPVREIETIFDFSAWGGIIRFTEQCNGSGDCRKTEKTGGTMCPSYMATRDEYTTTRARANLLREFLTNSGKDNPFDSRELYDILDLCLSCKGCKSECPSNVDMAKLKAEFLQHWHDANGIPLRARMIAHITTINQIGSLFPGLFNLIVSNRLLSGIIKKFTGFAGQRSIPGLYKTTLRRWARNRLPVPDRENGINGLVILFVDEFSEYNDTAIGIMAVQLLTRLGYEVKLIKHEVSGRTFISKGFLRKAREIAKKNIEIFDRALINGIPLLGIEPSAILSFRDEYPDLAGENLLQASRRVAASAMMIDEFIAGETEKGKITSNLFTLEQKDILLHGHCQQKAVASTAPTMKMLSLPVNYKVKEIKSGCCGMAGSFGYEKEHYDLSIKVGELVLFPEVRAAGNGTIIAAPGTSCRHHILDGTGKQALHPVEILFKALK
jgi:FAD/FMN-containing dehydrogenase/Fe-S oxidoreductase